MASELSTDEVVLSAHMLSKSYGNLTALNALSFELRAGEIVGLLGPNGAGKTTAIRILSTILLPDEGDFDILGVPGTQAEQIRGLIGVHPESMGFPGEMSGSEYLIYFGQLYGQTEETATEKASQLLDMFGLEHTGHARISTYRRGMRQR